MGTFSAEICKAEFDVKENFKTYRELYAGSLQRATGGKVKWSFGY
jgi:hypothetical protein